MVADPAPQPAGLPQADAVRRGRDSRRIGATLLTIILVAGALGVAEGWYAWRFANAGLWILAAVTTAFAAVLVAPWLLTRRGRNDVAVFVSCITIFAIQGAYLAVYPQAYPALAIASVVIVALALSFVRGRRLFGLIAAAWIVAILAVVVGVLSEPRFDIPAGAAAVVLLGSGVAAVTVGMMLLWQFAKDMTEAWREERLALDRLRQAHEELREQERLKSRFINAAAHELNTPMTPVMLQLHLLRSGQHAVHDPHQERMVQVLERNLERMKSLVHEMLDVARLQAGRLPLREVFDVADAARAAVDDFRLVAEARQVALRLEAPGPVPVTADRRRVEQVVSNPVSNAVRVTPAGGTVTVAASAEPDGTLVQVRDTGLGLSADQLAALFQPFTRVHDEGLQGAGSGLGLFICKGLAKEMGGRLWAESGGPGQGATFSFLIPPRPPAREPLADDGARPTQAQAGP